MKIGVIGGGQLAQMLALAGYPLGLKIICLEPTADCPASLVTDVINGQYDDVKKLQQLATAVDVMTYEFENISAAALTQMQHTALYPPATALAISQDRLQEKRFFEQLHIPTTTYAEVNSLEELQQALEHINIPAMLKTRRLGYDGKGQYSINQPQDIAPAWKALEGHALLVETKINFQREVSCIGVRNTHDDVVFYPLVENQHRNGILHLSQVSNEHHDDRITQLAQTYVGNILRELNYVGVLTVEFFQQGDQLIANEIAPRVHNSGHWTIEGADTSQFENHLRAVCGLPLGATNARNYVAMVNIVGEIPDTNALLRIAHTHCHLYGKTPRPGRKLGSVTLCADDRKTYVQQLQAILECIK